jgi:NTP pyrophosphatase (non-canonical NTP hydrolase)
MTPNEYQKLAERTNTVTGDFALIYAALGLAGEAGEVANKVKKIVRDDNNIVSDEKRAVIQKEIGDVMWYIARLCTELDVSLEDVMQQNIVKLAKRMERGTIQGDGDNR